jgi:hypothetical protein
MGRKGIAFYTNTRVNIIILIVKNKADYQSVRYLTLFAINLLAF